LVLFDLFSRQSWIKNSSASLWEVRHSDRGDTDSIAR
jgi:hypothetical protein